MRSRSLRGRFERRDRGWLLFGLVALVVTPLVVLGAEGHRVAATVLMLTIVAMAFGPPVGAAYDRSEDAAVERATLADHAGAEREALVFRFSRGRQTGLAVVGLGFAALGMLIATGAIAFDDEPTTDGGRWLGVVCVVMGGIMGPLNLRQARRAQLVALFDDGLLHRALGGDAWLPWPAIAGAWITSVRSAEFVTLEVRAPELVRLPAPSRLLGPLNRRISGGDHDIPVVALRADGDELLAEIERRIAT